MAASVPEREFNCWNCNYFQPIDATTRLDGECRRNRPDQLMNNSLPDGAVVSGWPDIEDGVEKWCANFKRDTGRTVPAIPTIP